MEIADTVAFAKELVGHYFEPAAFIGFSGYTAYRSSKTKVTQESRFWSTLSLVGVDVNYAMKLVDDLARGDAGGIMLDFAGLSSILCVTGRSFLMYHFNFCEKDPPERKRLQQAIVWSCLGLASTLVIGGQAAGMVGYGQSFDWGSLLTIAAIGFGTRADGVNLSDPKQTVTWRRRYLLGMALCQMAFGYHTELWALKAKATVDAVMRVRYDPITEGVLRKAVSSISFREVVRSVAARTVRPRRGAKLPT